MEIFFSDFSEDVLVYFYFLLLLVFLLDSGHWRSLFSFWAFLGAKYIE